jgi:hypothetical protein
MNTDDFFSGHPVRTLGELRAIRPDEAWEGRVHAKCLAAIARERRSQAVLAGRVVDAALVTAVSLYLVFVVAAALALAPAG